MSIENIVQGISVECYDELDDKPARIVIRGKDGKTEATVYARIKNNRVRFLSSAYKLEKGYERRQCNICGEGLGFSEGNVCERHS